MNYNLLPNLKNEIPFIPQIKTHNNLLGELITVSKKNGTKDFETRLIDKTGKIFGSEVFSIDKTNSNILGHIILTDPNYRRKGYYLGEILRLSSIIAMVENHIKTFKIFSRKTAAFFHAKYKFSPNTSNIAITNSILDEIIINCKNKDPLLSKNAKNLLNKINLNNHVRNIDPLCKNANTLINEYMQTVLNNKNKYEPHTLSASLNMQLTIDDVYKNKDFFNALFEKHKIDYKI